MRAQKETRQCPFFSLRRQAVCSGSRGVSRRVTFSPPARLILPLFVALWVGLAQTPLPAQAADSASVSSDQNPQQALTVPFTPLRGHGGPLVSVTLNGRIQATFLVDTGTNVCAISKALVARLGLTPRPALQSDGKPLMTGGRQSQAVIIEKLQFGSEAVKGQGTLRPIRGQFIVAPDQLLRVPKGRTVDGIIGTILLRFLAVDFDFPRHTLTFYYPGSLSREQLQAAGLANKGDAALALTPRSSDGLYEVTARFSHGAAVKQSLLMVDTGGKLTLIPRAVVRGLALTPVGQLQEAGGSQGTFIVDEVRMPSLRLGSLWLLDAPVYCPDTGDYTSTLGLDILSRRRALLDFPGRRMYLAAPATPAAAAE